jgi:hypothetical protein
MTSPDQRRERIADAAERALSARENWRNLSGPELIEAATDAIMDTQANLARLSGMTPNTITALKQGKRPSAAQRAAILWAVFARSA